MQRKIEARQVSELLMRQLEAWPLLKNNYEQFGRVQTKTVDVDGQPVIVQFNPSRIVSSGAKTDPRSLRERKCFLCSRHRPPEQESVPFGPDYLVLCNPFPIFPQHFTVPARRHTGQAIIGRMADMLDLAAALDAYTVFYNGPRSGASAPDHMHFQLVTKNYMPIDTIDVSQAKPVCRKANARLCLLENCGRNGWIITSGSKEEAQRLFAQLCRALHTPPGETEPMMNIFCNYEKDRWILKIIPRKKHRPSHYFAPGDAQFLSSPGAADIGGVFITSRQQDFSRASSALLADIYRQVCFDADELKRIKIE
jgi:hypothetical protein